MKKYIHEYQNIDIYTDVLLDMASYWLLLQDARGEALAKRFL